MRHRIVAGAVALVGMAGVSGAAVVIDDPAIDPAGPEGARGARASGVALARAGLGERAPDGDEPPPRVHWTVPGGSGLLVPAAPTRARAPEPRQVRAHAYQFVSRVFERPGKKASALGFVRRNRVLPVDERVPGTGCKSGAWYRLMGPGFVCSRDGFAVSRQERPEITRQPPPAVERALPFDYAKAKPDALRFYSMPTVAESEQIAAALEAEKRLPDVVERKLDGIFLLALDRLEKDDERKFYRTVRGRFVRAEDVDPKPEPGMRGELLDAETTLPLAFVYGDEPAPLYRRVGDERVEAGRADVHARFQVEREDSWDGTAVLVGPGGLAVARDRARLVRRRARPETVASGERWIHVDLDEQALVAYEGDTPVMATLVSSGKGAEFATPKGLFQINEKHITATMSGPDPDEGYYEVEEVPWTQYYHDSFALHGAYWHDEFGKTRSHGCTNISPIDARWLFYWTEGTVPPAWNAVRQLEGTWVYFTRELPPQ